MFEVNNCYSCLCFFRCTRMPGRVTLSSYDLKTPKNYCSKFEVDIAVLLHKGMYRCSLDNGKAVTELKDLFDALIDLARRNHNDN